MMTVSIGTRLRVTSRGSSLDSTGLKRDETGLAGGHHAVAAAAQLSQALCGQLGAWSTTASSFVELELLLARILKEICAMRC